MLHDAHLHIKDKALLLQMKKFDIEGIANVSDLEEYYLIKEFQKSWKKLHMSVGIHPWKVDQTDYNSLLPYLHESKIIGEIGLDNVWCNCDINKQRNIFKKQIILACQTKKSVILHTKGMEKNGNW